MSSIFPDGWPGIGLFLLRAALGAVFVFQASLYFGTGSDLRGIAFAVAMSTAVVGVLLLLGFLARFAGLSAAIVCVIIASSRLPGIDVGLFAPRMASALTAVIGASVVCLGPGAFSVDARLFGRREIIIPDGSSNT